MKRGMGVEKSRFTQTMIFIFYKSKLKTKTKIYIKQKSKLNLSVRLSYFLVRSRFNFLIDSINLCIYEFFIKG